MATNPAQAMNLTTLTPLHTVMAPDTIVDPVRANLPAIKQMFTAKLYPSSFPMGPLYVNEKQYYRILKRRHVRLKLNNNNKVKVYMHESRHKHAMNRPRGPGGRFLGSGQTQSNKSSSPNENNTKNDQNDQNSAIEHQHQQLHQQQQQSFQHQSSQCHSSHSSNSNQNINDIIDHPHNQPHNQPQLSSLVDQSQLRQILHPHQQQDSVFSNSIDLNQNSLHVSQPTSIPQQQPSADASNPMSIQAMSHNLNPSLQVHKDM